MHKKYVEPIKELILSGLQQPNEGHTLSLIFQGLANLAKFEDWGSGHQNQLVLDLLDMAQEIPKDSQHASLKAISRLLSVPREGIDVYDLLISVHATFGSRSAVLDTDLKALVAEVYGHLGTVERNVSIYYFICLTDLQLISSQPVISRVRRDSRRVGQFPTDRVVHRTPEQLSIASESSIRHEMSSDRKLLKLGTDPGRSSSITSTSLLPEHFHRLSPLDSAYAMIETRCSLRWLRLASSSPLISPSFYRNSPLSSMMILLRR